VSNRHNGIGRIFFVCSHCGFVFYRYALGDPKNRSKYSGAPTPEQVLSGFDELRCPRCGRKLSLKPLKIKIMSRAEFESKYIDMGFLILEREGEMVLHKTVVEEENLEVKAQH